MKTIESILVATDLSEISDEVVSAAGALAAMTGARLHVLHAFDLQALPYPPESVTRITFDDRVQEAERELDRQIARALPSDVSPASREVVIYLAHKAIVERAEATGSDLVVLGPHRRRRGDVFLGSTADRVIRTAAAPCLVVRAPLSLPVRRVVVPLDLSRPSVGALEVSLRWADALRPDASILPGGPEVVVMHVIPRAFESDSFAFDREVIGPELGREVEAARARAGVRGPLEVREEVMWGDRPADEIVAVAGREKADLVVLATHGHGAVKRALIGSVASGVARAAPCPVLLVPLSAPAE